MKVLFKKLFLFLIIPYISLSTAQATTFVPLSFEQQVEEANRAAEVVLKEKRSFQNQMGMIFTEYSFQVEENFNLNSEDFDGEYLKITMIGGTVNGLTSHVDGAPNFELEEKSFLLLKKIDSKIYLSNFSLGKYKIITVDGEVYYQSSVFAQDPKMGKIKKAQMLDLLKVKGQGDRDNGVLKNKKDSEKKESTVFEGNAANEKERIPASKVEQEKEFDFQLLFLGLAFLVISLIGIYSLRKIK